jgi:hypothetical protein
MTTREDFKLALYMAMNPDRVTLRDRYADAVLAAWDALAAEVVRLRAEVDALRTGDGLTRENAPRAWVAACDGMAWIADRDGGWWHHNACWRTDVMCMRGATVLAWRKP